MSDYTLHNVISAAYLEPPPSAAMRMVLDVTIGQTRSELDFVYRPEDSYGLSGVVKVWLAENHQFEPAPYEP